MKMENNITAETAGKIVEVKVARRPVGAGDIVVVSGGGDPVTDHERRTVGAMTDAKDHRPGRPRRTAATPWSTLSHRIHAHPELNFEEVRVVGVVAGDPGRRRASRSRWASADLPTAFVGHAPAAARCTSGSAPSTTPCPASATPAATTSSPPRPSAPAWPCGRVADDLGLTVTVLGTPAEEGGGGKILMLERGAFDGVHAAMMVHPSPAER